MKLPRLPAAGNILEAKYTPKQMKDYATKAITMSKAEDIAELEHENKLLRARNERLEKELAARPKVTSELLLTVACAGLSPDQHDHFMAMSKYQPDIYEHLANAINRRLEEKNA